MLVALPRLGLLFLPVVLVVTLELPHVPHYCTKLTDSWRICKLPCFFLCNMQCAVHAHAWQEACDHMQAAM